MKRILFVTYDFPYPVTSGGKSRAYHLLKFGKNKQNKLFLYSLVRETPSDQEVQEIKKIGVSEIFLRKRKKAEKGKLFIKSFFAKNSMFKYLYFEDETLLELEKVCIDNKIDVIQFESFYTAYFASSLFSDLVIKQVYGSENIEHVLYEDLARFSKNPVLKSAYSFQAKKIKKEEIDFYKKTDETLVVTKSEGKVAQNLGAKKVTIIPNGIDVAAFKYKNSKSKKIKNLLFVGNFSYFPNVYAANYIFKEIFSKLSKDIVVTIIGRGQGKISSIPKNNKRVKSIEFIEDIRDAYYNADALLFPVRIGGGTNFKILEAAACGLPIIAFPQKVEGLGFKDKENFLSCENAVEFVDVINSLDLDSVQIHKMTISSRRLVENNYSWENIGKEQAKVWQKI